MGRNTFFSNKPRGGTKKILGEDYLEKIAQIMSYDAPDSAYWNLTTEGREFIRNIPLRQIQMTPEGPAFVISEAMINPISYIWTEYMFSASCWLEIEIRLSQRQQDRELFIKLVTLGYLFGKFDEQNPHSWSYREIISPHIRDDDPPFIQRLKIPEAEAAQDQPRLQLLKNFWYTAFLAYWAGLRRHQRLSLAPLKGESAKVAAQAVPDYEMILPTAQAQGLTGARYQQVRTSLFQYITEIVQAYNPDQPHSLESIRAVFDHRLASKLLDFVGAKLHQFDFAQSTNGQLSKLASRLITAINQNQDQDLTTQVFGTEFTQLAPIEQVCLITFTAFVSNGSTTKGIEAAVAQIEGTLLPILQKHHESKNSVSFDLPFPPPDIETTYPQAKKAALERLYELTLADGLVEAQNPKLVTELEARERALVDLTQLSKEILITDRTETETDIIVPMLVFLMMVLFITTSLSVRIPPHRSVLANLFISLPSYFLITNRYQMATLRNWLNQLSILKQYQDKLKGQLKKIDANYQKKKKEYIWLIAFINLMITTIVFGAVAIFDAVESEPTHAIGNSGSPPQRGNPSFYTFFGHSGDSGHSDQNVQGPDFWLSETCEMAPDRARLLCRNKEEDGIPGKEHTLPIETLPDQAALKQQIEQEQAQGNIIRLNLNSQDSFFEIPVGWEPIKILIVGKIDSDARPNHWSSEQGLVVEGLESTQLTAVVYRPTQPSNNILGQNSIDVYQTRPDVYNPYGPDLIPDVDWDTPELKPLKATIINARQQLRDGVDPKIILKTMLQVVKELGLDYGFQEHHAHADTPSEQLRSMLARNSDGTLKHDQWICNEFAYLIYVMAREAGMEIYLLPGYVQSPHTGWGGYGSQGHMILGFRNQQNQIEIFDATLPDTDGNLNYPSIPREDFNIFDYLKKQEQQRMIFATCALTAAILGLGVLGKRTHD
ncbi:MAG: hypothetical protein GF390_02895, partial [Candidatus Pacebacteria bacterium]|nr:hypothetical protein [Candidatus Paceibacterota bacterium]